MNGSTGKLLGTGFMKQKRPAGVCEGALGHRTVLPRSPKMLLPARKGAIFSGLDGASDEM
jgi:hypothetical protein